MTYYYPRSPTPILSRTNAAPMLRVSQSSNDTLRALITFYQDEQYWVRRTRMVMQTDAPEAPRIDSYTTIPMDTSSDIPLPTSEPTRLPLDDATAPAPMLVDGEPPDQQGLAGDGGGHARRRSRTRLQLDDLLLQPRHGDTRKASPSELRSRILDTFSDLLDARMESCQRMSRMIEMRECRMF